MILPLDVQLALDPLGGPEFVLSAGVHEALRLRVETEGAGDEYRDAVAHALGVDVVVEPIPPGTLPRSTFKPRRIQIA